MALRIIDARSGADVRIDEWVVYPPPEPMIRFYGGKHSTAPDGTPELAPEWRDPSRWTMVPNPERGVCLPGFGMVNRASYRLLELRDRFLSADGRFQMADGKETWARLTVRLMHPNFLLQRVAFVPS